MNNTDYQSFIDNKGKSEKDHGFSPLWIPNDLYPFQAALTEWALIKGRAAVFADCGLGKTPMQLVWAENVVRETNGRVLILAPLAVGPQTAKEGYKFGVECTHVRDGNIPAGKKIIVTNYEKLHLFNAADFSGCVCDESSILKNFDGATRQSVTEFMKKIKYRLLCTATAAPNDYLELGTSSEAIGDLERKHMLAQFFTHDGGETSKWCLKGHARSRMFWRWVCSWARAIRKPSDLGYSDGAFVLPRLSVREHVVDAKRKADGFLLDIPACGLSEQREEGRRTIVERCEMVAQLISAHNHPAVAWCQMVDEGHLLEKMIPGAVEVEGADAEEKKEEILSAFASGEIRVLVTKPTIAGFGLNWQHCAHQSLFPSHSYEQYYQSIRRSWRFGQKNPVVIDVVTTDGQAAMLENLKRKNAAAEEMFCQLIAHMRNEMSIQPVKENNKKEEIPSWL